MMTLLADQVETGGGGVGSPTDPRTCRNVTFEFLFFFKLTGSYSVSVCGVRAKKRDRESECVGGEEGNKRPQCWHAYRA